MRKIFYTLSILIIIFITSSCAKEWLNEDSAFEPGTITLTLQSLDAQCKATQEGVSDYNENLIKSIHYFFYPKDGTDSNTEKEPAKMGCSLNLDKQNNHTLTIKASEDEIKNVLFKYPYNDCDVYVIVNLPSEFKYGNNTYSSLDDLPDRKLSTLKNIVFTTNFESNIIQPAFVMDGLSVATVIDRNKVLAADGEVPVDRVASKITVFVEVIDEISKTVDIDEGSGNRWTSLPDKMTIELVNGVNRTLLSGDPSNLSLDATDRFRDINSSITKKIVDGVELWYCEPFYSYPYEWEIGAEDEPYLFITLPWETVINTNVDGEDPPIYKQYDCYYKVMLGNNVFKRNTWYNINVEIGILGSFENTPEVILPIDDIKYFVANWSDGNSFDTEILGAKYLVADNVLDYYEIFNENSITIPFTTSHDCEIVDVSCTYLNLNTGSTVNEPASKYSVTLENGKSVVITHELNNNMFSTDFDFTPFTFTFTIRHKDNHSYSQEITVVQYPAIYAEGQRNSDSNSTGHGNVWVNGYNDDDTSPNAGQDFFGGANGNRQGAYPSMYVFTITTTEGTNFIIGDPRDTEPTYDADDARWYVGDAIFDGDPDRELKYYYGTTVANERYSSNQTGLIYSSDEEAEAAEPTINMIAPKFRLASGYGTVTQTTGANLLETMKKRCASYQEDGYPAGRWRLPTRAEFQFILTQINLGNLPGVYLENYDYWCAHGLGEPEDGIVKMNYISNSQGGGYTSITPVRCVYDEWYWENSNSYRLGVGANGSYTPFNTFTWGDMPRENFDAKTL